MPGWDLVDDDRWVRHDDGGPDERHLMLRTGGRLIEVHGTTVHAYTAAEVLDPESPLTGATWAGTWERPDLDGADTDALWQAMGDEQYTIPAPASPPPPRANP